MESKEIQGVLMDSAQPFDQFKELVQMLKPSAFAATKPQPSPHTNIPHQSILINTTAVSSHSVVDSQHTYCLFKHLYRLELHLIETTKLQKGQSFGLLPGCQDAGSARHKCKVLFVLGFPTP